jgi:uncharacterized protein YegP (UPF0339 family)
MITQMRTLGIGLLLAFVILAPATSKAASSTLALDHTTATLIGPVHVKLDHGPGHLGEWIGLFPVSVELTDVSSYVDWQWVTGGRSNSGIDTAGTLTFPTGGQPLAAGHYEFRWISGGRVIAQSEELTLGDTSKAGTSLTLDRPTAKPNDHIKVKFNNSPEGSREWIGLFPSTAASDDISSYVDWQWVTGGRTTIGYAKNGTLTFPTDGNLALGQYVFRLVSDGKVIAQSELLTVSNSAGDGPGLDLTRYKGEPTDLIKVQFSHGRKGNREWIGLFPVSAAVDDISSYVDWQWVTGGQTKIGSDADGTLTFPTNGSLPFGQYVFRWISNGKVVAQSALITIGEY